MPADSGREADARQSRFPWFVLCFSVVLALALFCFTTVPALAEHRELLAIAQNKENLRREVLGQAANLVRARRGLSHDVQAMLVELDRQGIFPAREVEQLRQQRSDRRHGLIGQR